MVPVEFWAWAIPQVKAVNPNVIFIAEIYNPGAYKKYIAEGKFDYLYDKVGLYDALKPLIMNADGANANTVYLAWKQTSEYGGNMLRFLENHDELRLASRQYAKDAWRAIPAMGVSATMSTGPVMIYFGQELGESADGTEGFSGTTEDDHFRLLGRSFRASLEQRRRLRRRQVEYQPDEPARRLQETFRDLQGQRGHPHRQLLRPELRQ
jgi:glycosidase